MGIPPNNMEVHQQEAQTTPSRTLLQEDKKVQKRFDRQIWWLTNKGRLKGGVMFLFVVLEFVLGAIGLWGLADYFLIDYVEEQQFVDGFFAGADTVHDAVAQQGATPLRVGNATVLSSGDTFDVLSFVTNPNDAWVAEVDYHYRWQGKEVEGDTLTILQGATVPVVAFAQSRPRPQNAQLVIDHVNWLRIRPNFVSDPIEWRDDRLNLSVANVAHDDRFAIGDARFGRTTFELTNKSGYGYYDIDLYVVLKRSNTIVAVNRTSLSQLKALETRPIQLGWFESAPVATDVELYPVVNLFDPESYLSLDANVEEDLRDALQRR